MPQKLSYTTLGRGGYVFYKDDVSEIKLGFEFGGGNCVAIIFIPSPQQWAAATGRTLQERGNIIQFIAAQALKDQVAGGYYKILDNFIELYSGRQAAGNCQ